MVGDEGQVVLPLGLLAEAAFDAGSRLLAFSDGDGRIVLQREADGIERLLSEGTL